jgi:predicted transcriptional regulator
MEALWDTGSTGPDTTFTARDVAGRLPNHAYTTVLTVLDRLTKKGLVERIRDGRSHHYAATGSRESYIAELMHEALAATPDREAALVHFAETVLPEEASVLRDVLRRLDQPADPTAATRPAGAASREGKASREDRAKSEGKAKREGRAKIAAGHEESA